MSKDYTFAGGERGKSTSSPALDGLTQAQVDRERERMDHQSELEKVEHKKKMAQAEAETKKALREASGEPVTETLIRKFVDKFDPTASEAEAKHQVAEIKQKLEQSETDKNKLQGQLYTKEVESVKDKLSELTNELKAIREGKGSGGRTADEVIDEAVKTAEKLGYVAGGTPTISGEVQIQLKQLDINLQLQLAQMQEDRDRRDKDWQLTLKKWDEEKEMKRAELNQKADAENQRMAFLTNAEQRIGRIIARTMKGGSGISSGVSKEAAGKVFHVEAGEGEEGDISCPGCSNSIFVAPDATEVLCDSCGQTVEVRRTAKPTKGKGKSGAG